MGQKQSKSESLPMLDAKEKTKAAPPLSVFKGFPCGKCSITESNDETMIKHFTFNVQNPFDFTFYFADDQLNVLKTQPRSVFHNEELVEEKPLPKRLKWTIKNTNPQVIVDYLHKHTDTLEELHVCIYEEEPLDVIIAALEGLTKLSSVIIEWRRLTSNTEGFIQALAKCPKLISITFKIDLPDNKALDPAIFIDLLTLQDLGDNLKNIQQLTLEFDKHTYVSPKCPHVLDYLGLKGVFAQMTNLESLTLGFYGFCKITKAEHSQIIADALQECKKLRYLSLSLPNNSHAFNVDYVGIIFIQSALERLTLLTELHLDLTHQLIDFYMDFKCLTYLPKLKVLSLNFSNGTYFNAGVESFARALENIEVESLYLDLKGSLMTYKGLMNVVEHLNNSIKKLHLIAFCPMSNEEMIAILHEFKKLTNLSSLHLEFVRECLHTEYGDIEPAVRELKARLSG
jgi:hypothetical protein